MMDKREIDEALAVAAQRREHVDKIVEAFGECARTMAEALVPATARAIQAFERFGWECMTRAQRRRWCRRLVRETVLEQRCRV
jgi:hypothetical protein